MKKTIKNNLLNTSVLLLATILAGATHTTTAIAQTAKTANSSGAWGVKNPLFDAVAGKLNLTANLGYVFNFASNWDGNDIGTGTANGAVGYGARLGWTHKSGFGVSGDYLGFTSKWSNGGTDYTNPYNILTITPSYRFSFGQNKEWGVKVGLGVGMSLADVSWGTTKTAKGVNAGASRKVAGGALYQVGTGASATSAQQLAAAPSACMNAQNGFINTSDSRSTDAKNKCNDRTTIVTNAQIATWLIARGVTSSDGVSLNISGSGVGIDMGGANGTTTSNVNFGPIAPEVACLVNGGTWNGAADSATATSADCTPVIQAAASDSGSGGSAKDDAGFVLAPEIAVEYDNGLFHGDINLRYIHGLANVKYDGQNTTANQLQKSGPLALFIGAGLGVNF
ncbi:MAG: hypothetical protein QM529_07555 [Hydrotalea sp.]|nr:hypothetical protein [Hydrotalea sp.]